MAVRGSASYGRLLGYQLQGNIWAEIEPQILLQPIPKQQETDCALPALTCFASEWESLLPHQLPSLLDLKSENAGQSIHEMDQSLPSFPEGDEKL